jgi:beta-xylosidase
LLLFLKKKYFLIFNILRMFNNNLTMKKIILVFLVAILVVSCKFSNKTITQESTNDATIIGGLKYPYKFKFEGNPLSRMHSATDPDVQVYDDEIWVYVSQDRNIDSLKHKAHYDAMDGYHAFSSKDMVNWIDHGEIFHSKKVAWAKGGFLWAPGSARKNGKYYLYYPIKDKNLEWKIGVALGDTPAGPFTDTGKPIAGVGGIDPKVFIDDDGQAYIYHNSASAAKLKPNMIEVEAPSEKVIYGSEDIMKTDTTRFSEGSYMHKRNGIYYYSYTCLKNRKNHGHYATGKNPLGPFEYKGAMAPRPIGAQDHHSIVEFKGQWYYFYHISLKDLPKYKESQGRIVCFDKLYYNPDGTIQMVKHTR